MVSSRTVVMEHGDADNREACMECHGADTTEAHEENTGRLLEGSFTESNLRPLGGPPKISDWLDLLDMLEDRLALLERQFRTFKERVERNQP